MNSDFIFDGKTLSNVFEDIYNNSNNKRQQIELFIAKLVKMIKTPDEAAIIAPIVKDFLEVAVKNDEHIVRVAQIAQRLQTVAAKTAGGMELLSEAEKMKLLSDVNDLKEDASQLEDELERLGIA